MDEKYGSMGSDSFELKRKLRGKNDADNNDEKEHFFFWK